MEKKRNDKRWSRIKLIRLLHLFSIIKEIVTDILIQRMIYAATI
jgi:hypothetical protein